MSKQSFKSRLRQKLLEKTKQSDYAYIDIHNDQEIRVLKVYPGYKESPLECRLLTCPLLDSQGQPFLEPVAPVPYTALSYHWGEAMETEALHMFHDEDMHTQIKRLSTEAQSHMLRFVSCFFVKKNLHQALRELRSETESIYLWIDAVCINQDNDEEKTAQVLHMHEIYMQAERVCVWLGEGGESSSTQHPFQFLTSILDIDKLEDYETGYERNDETCTAAYSEIISLMQASWFGRRWVIQELMLATDAYVRYGHGEMNWPDFAEAIGLFTSIHPHTRNLGSNVLVTATDTLFKKSRKGRIEQRLGSLEQLITSVLLPFEASDPKDIVFSVLQIAKDTSTFGNHDQKKQPFLMALVGIIFHGGLLFLSTRYCNTLEMSLNRIARVSPPLLHNIIPARFAQKWYSASKSTYKKKQQESTPILPTSLQRSLEPFVPRLVSNDSLYWILRCLLWFFLFTVGFWWNAWKLWNHLNNVLPKQDLPPRRPNFHDRRIEPDYSKSLLDVWSGFIEYCIETSKSLDVICRGWSPSVDEHRKIPSWMLPIKQRTTYSNESKTTTQNEPFAWVPGKSRIYNASGRSSPSFKFDKRNIVQKSQLDMPSTSRPGEYSQIQKLKPPPPPSFRQRLLQVMRGTPQVIELKEEVESQFDGILHVEGIRIGTIDEVSLIPDSILNSEILDILGFSTILVSTDAQFEPVWRTLVAGRGLGGSDPPGWYSRACRACIEWYLKDPDDFVKRSTRRTTSGRLTRRVEFMERVQQVARNRKCFRSYHSSRDLNPVGLAPPNAELGDLICVLFGCSVPVVLRPSVQESQQGYYTFIGECYVDGMMNGEVVSRRAGQQEWFKLR